MEQKGKIELGFSLVGLLDFESSWDFESKTGQVRMKLMFFFSKKMSQARILTCEHRNTHARA